MCQNHGKEVDDDYVRFAPDILRAWKACAEEDARDLLGRPISAQSLDIAIKIAAHRASDESLLITGNTNLPTGTKLWVELCDTGTHRILGQAKTVVVDGMFAAPGFTRDGKPYPHGWYTFNVLAYFNGPWQQPEAVTQIVGREGEYLVGRFAEPLHPEFEESEKRLYAVFECIAPALSSAKLPTDVELRLGVSAVQRSVLTVDGRKSASPISEVVELYMSSPGLRTFNGWSAKALANGAIAVSYSFWNAEVPEIAEWTVILETGEVRYRNLYAKYMSWTPDY